MKNFNVELLESRLELACHIHWQDALDTIDPSEVHCEGQD
jgi:hypothetical protein